MGVVAQSILRPRRPNDLSVVMFVGCHPPVSCTIDGVQVASGCTLGRGTIQVSEVLDRIVDRFQLGSYECGARVKDQLVDEL